VARGVPADQAGGAGGGAAPAARGTAGPAAVAAATAAAEATARAAVDSAERREMEASVASGGTLHRSVGVWSARLAAGRAVRRSGVVKKAMVTPPDKKQSASGYGEGRLTAGWGEKGHEEGGAKGRRTSKRCSCTSCRLRRR